MTVNGAPLYVELAWHSTAGTGKVAVARLSVGIDQDIVQTVAVVLCSPEVMNVLDRMLTAGAGSVPVRYVGKETPEKEMGG